MSDPPVPVVQFFSCVEPDLETFGNHDFDHGYAAAREVGIDPALDGRIERVKGKG